MLEDQPTIGQGEQTAIAPTETEQTRPLCERIIEAIDKAAERFPEATLSGEKPKDLGQKRLSAYQDIVRSAFDIAERALIRGSFVRSAVPDLSLLEKIIHFSEIRKGIIGKQGTSTPLTPEEQDVRAAFWPGGDVNFLREETSIAVPFITNVFSEDSDQRNTAYMTEVARNVGILREEETWTDFIARAKTEGLGLKPLNDTPESQRDPLKEPVLFNHVPTALPKVTAEIFFYSTSKTDNSKPLAQSVAETSRVPGIILEVPTTALLV